MKVILEKGDLVEMKDNQYDFGAEYVELLSYAGNGIWNVEEEESARKGQINVRNIRGVDRNRVNVVNR